MDSLKFQVHTFGCKVNTYDTGLLQKNLIRSGLKLDSNDPKIHVLNTCAVTAEATKEAVRTIRKIKAQSPLSLIVVTGCAAQVDTGAFENLPGADLVIANSHKGLLPFYVDQYFKGQLKERVFKSNIFRKDDLEEGGGLEESHTRAFVKIQDGCNSFCSYCIIPYARGKSRSIPVMDLVRRVNEISAQGFEEVVLTGVHIGDYEDPSQPGGARLEDLLEALLKMTKVPRYRLTSLEPVEVTPRLLDLYQDPRMCAHLHMSIQSANTEVLAGMKRNYTQKEVIESLNNIEKKIPGAFVGMDVITGFPTETDAQFEDTYKTLAETPWTRLHVFPYSERKGTKAALMPQIYPHVRKERAQRLRELSLHRYQSEALKQVGREKWALGLRDSKTPQGVTRDYWTVLLNEVPPARGEFKVRIDEVVVKNSPRLEGVLRGSYV
ncbi:MAG: tRNA (N(6)-L-threonylcarbamoyladenosine(37)-C(2))-methylthiotransferase MtaB [Bdellovibrio sp.]|jgi:threonylcarbamoyladenosine tRNA methylthiotransferase MtaB